MKITIPSATLLVAIVATEQASMGKDGHLLFVVKNSTLSIVASNTDSEIEFKIEL
jgi:hypothetical protein